MRPSIRDYAFKVEIKDASAQVSSTADLKNKKDRGLGIRDYAFKVEIFVHCHQKGGGNTFVHSK